MGFSEIEKAEETAFAVVVQALRDYLRQAETIFREETDRPQDIAEDITREAIEEMGISSIRERLYGNVDYKKAIYVFLPEPFRVALMVDSKAEKSDERTVTIQMSQTSMNVKMIRAGNVVDEPGKLQNDLIRDGDAYHVVTVFVKFSYEESENERRLAKIIATCVPNGKLQQIYNPNENDTFWLVGRDAPTRGEDFRVRVSFGALREKSLWRVVEMPVGPDADSDQT